MIIKNLNTFKIVLIKAQKFNNKDDKSKNKINKIKIYHKSQVKKFINNCSFKNRNNKKRMKPIQIYKKIKPVFIQDNPLNNKMIVKHNNNKNKIKKKI